jgi:hypothetical protein
MKKIVFFDFASLEFGGGCEKNFLDLGLWLKERGHEVVFVAGTTRLNNLYCSLLRLGEHKKNIPTEEMIKKYKIDSYIQFDLVDIFSEQKKEN